MKILKRKFERKTNEMGPDKNTYDSGKQAPIINVLNTRLSKIK